MSQAKQVFVGTFMAMIAVVLLTGEARTLLRGPRALADWIVRLVNGHRCPTQPPRRLRRRKARPQPQPAPTPSPTPTSAPTPVAPLVLLNAMGAST